MKIVFNIITKNEESIILNSLNSVYDLVDAYCILDTGSTDNTLEILKKFKNDCFKPVKIIQSSFKDFSTSRNLVLEESKNMGDIVYWHDSDEYINPDIPLKTFKGIILDIFLQGYSSIDTTIKFNEYSYARKNIFLNKEYYWYGIIHEYLYPINIGKEKIYTLDIPLTIVTTKGSSHTNINKYYTYGNMLLKEFEKNKNPRDLFYAANSFKDYSLINKKFWNQAVYCYLERAKLEGYQEERYISLLYAARLLKENNQNFIDVLISCEELYLNRIEHLYELALYYYELEFYNVSYIYSKLAYNKLLENSNYKLFVEYPIYNYKLLDIHLINCYKTNRIEEFKNTQTKLFYNINNYSIPENDFKRISDNIKI